MLRKNERQLLDAICRRVDRTARTATKLERLQTEARLERRAFFRAKAVLIDSGLIEEQKREGRWVIGLLPPEQWRMSPLRRGENYPQEVVESTPKKRRKPPPANGPNARHTAISADTQQKTKKQLEGKTEAQTVRTALEKQASLRLDVTSPGWVLDRVVHAVAVDKLSLPRIEDEALSIALELQSQGALVPAFDIVALMKDAAALLDLMTVAIEGEIVGVHEVHS